MSEKPDAAVQLLLSDERYDVNAQDSRGDTALMRVIGLIETEGDNYYKATEALLNHPHVDLKQDVAVQLLISNDYYK